MANRSKGGIYNSSYGYPKGLGIAIDNRYLSNTTNKGRKSLMKDHGKSQCLWLHSTAAIMLGEFCINHAVFFLNQSNSNSVLECWCRWSPNKSNRISPNSVFVVVVWPIVSTQKKSELISSFQDRSLWHTLDMKDIRDGVCATTWRNLHWLPATLDNIIPTLPGAKTSIRQSRWTSDPEGSQFLPHDHWWWCNASTLLLKPSSQMTLI